MFTINLIGQESNYLSTSFTASLALSAVEELLTNRMRVYIDPVSNCYWATLVSSQVLGFKLVLEAYWEPLPVGGQLFWTLAQFMGKRITDELTFLHDAALSGTGGTKLDWHN